MTPYHCDLSACLRGLQGPEDIDAFVLVDASLPIELAPLSPFDRIPVLAAAGVGWRSIPPNVPTEVQGIYKLDTTTGHSLQAANTVTKVVRASF